MIFQRIIILLLLISILSCEYQTFSGPKLDQEKMEYVNYYLELLDADNIEVNPLNHEWDEGDLPIVIENSNYVKVITNDELSNEAVVDTLASLLWDAVDNKSNYKKITFGFVENDKVIWLNYPTNIIK